MILNAPFKSEKTPQKFCIPAYVRNCMEDSHSISNASTVGSLLNLVHTSVCKSRNPSTSHPLLLNISGKDGKRASPQSAKGVPSCGVEIVIREATDSWILPSFRSLNSMCRASKPPML